MKANFLKYDYKVTLLVQNDGNRHFCGDYNPLNAQTWKDAYIMPLINDVLMS
jgi:hypothetical protein